MPIGFGSCMQQLWLFFETEWKSIQEVYNCYDPNICAYLAKEWIIPYKTKFVRCYTNQRPHFFNTATSKGEGGNATLKRELRFSTGKRSFCAHYPNCLVRILIAPLFTGVTLAFPIAMTISVSLLLLLLRALPLIKLQAERLSSQSGIILLL